MAVVLVEGGDQLPALVGQYEQVVGKSGGSSLIADYFGGLAVLVTVLVGAMAWYCS